MRKKNPSKIYASAIIIMYHARIECNKIGGYDRRRATFVRLNILIIYIHVNGATIDLNILYKKIEN